MEKTSVINRFDSITLDETYFTKEGYLIDHPVVTSTGIFVYHDKKTGRERRELRLPEEVFDQESLDSYKGKPIIVTHNANYVDKANVKKESIGTILSAGYQDGDNVKAEIIIHDMGRVQKTQLRELSVGYELELDETPGIWEGQAYDAVQHNIRVNHLALVATARAGKQARLNIDEGDDLTKGGKIMSMDPKTPDTEGKEPVADGKEPAAPATDPKPEGGATSTTVKKAVTDFFAKKDAETGKADNTDADPVEKIKKNHSALKENKPANMDEASAYIDRLEGIVNSLMGVIDTQKAAKANDSQSEPPKQEPKPEPKQDHADSAEDFREMLRIVRVGDRLNLDGLEMLTAEDAKKAVISKVYPALNLDGKSKEYIDVSFDMAANDIKEHKGCDYQRQQMTSKSSRADSAAPGISKAEEARQRMIARMDGKDKKGE